MIGTAHTLDKLLETAASLYSLPAVAVRVLQLTEQPDVDTRALKECIENDPALSSKVLRVVNSSLFGLSRPVSDLTGAIAMLGIKPLKLLVLGFSLPERLFLGMAGEPLQRYWNRTLTKAVAAREISESIWKLPGDDPFIAGLFDDLGMLVLIQELGQPYVRFLNRTQTERADLHELELRVLGFDHRELSARLLEQWGMPSVIIQALHAARDPEFMAAQPPQQRSLAQILHLAELLSLLLAEGRTDLLPQLLNLALHYQGVTGAQLSSLTDRLHEKVTSLAEVLSLELPEGLDYRDVLVQAHARLSTVAADAAALLGRGSADPAVQRVAVSDEMRSLQGAVQSLASQPARTLETAPPLPADSSAASFDTRQEAVRTASSATAKASPEPTVLMQQVSGTIAACRQARCGLSLLLIEIDHYPLIVLEQGREQADRLVRLVHAACRATGHAQANALPLSPHQFAILLPGCDRLGTVEIANRLVRVVRHLETVPGEDPKITVSVGAATLALPPKNFPPEILVDSASRCLYGAQSGGGSMVKSIEL